MVNFCNLSQPVILNSTPIFHHKYTIRAYIKTHGSELRGQIK